MGKDKDFMRKTRKELRKEITESVNRLKSDIYLMIILEICEIYRKSVDDKARHELSELQRNQRKVINDILKTENAEHASMVDVLINCLRIQ